MKVFTIYDSKVNAYMNPIFLRSKGEAIRVLQHTVNSPDHQFNKNPEDFTLFELGSFDEMTSKFTLHAAPVSVVRCIELVNDDK